jgi:P-type Cu+ transporter
VRARARDATVDHGRDRKGAQAGILIRSAAALETAHKLDTIVLDKTGTLTVGKPTLTDIFAQPGWDSDLLLRYAASLEARSEHPLAGAIIAAAHDDGLTVVEPDQFDSVTGHGVRGQVDGHHVLIGTRRLLTDNGIDVTALTPPADALADDGKTAIFLAVDAHPAGVLAVADSIKPGAPAAVAALQRLGIAIESADITLMSGALQGVVTAIALSRATMRNIRQNLFFALIYNGVGIPIAAGVLYPALGWQLSPMIAAAAMAASSLSVVGNANRLRRYQPPEATSTMAGADIATVSAQAGHHERAVAR